MQTEGAPAQPSLPEMVSAALQHLDATGKRYCLMIEGSRIDHGGHDNDAAASAWDALAYNDAWATVLEHTGAGGGVEAGSPGRPAAQVVSLADHSTGGLTLGMNTDWDMKYEQEGVCRQGDECNASLGSYPYGTTNGWHPRVLAQVDECTL